MKKVCILFATAFMIYLLTSGGKTPFDYFVRLSDAFVHGRLYLTENPPWLAELIPAQNGRFFVPYAPGPAIILLPFVLLFGAQFPQQVVAHIVGAAIVLVSYLLAREILQKDKPSIWASILAGFGTIIWFEASVGSSWYLGQITGGLFLLLALFSAQKKKALFAGVALGMAYLSRIHLVFALPLILYMLKESHGFSLNPKDWLTKKTFLCLLGFGVFATANALYNFARFGVLWDKGYLLIPGVLDEPWFSHGIENVSYIPRNLKVAFWSFPKMFKEFPYIEPSWNGLSIWITSPVFIFAFLAPFKKSIVKFFWLTIFAIFIFVLAHGSNGFTQFGYRFAIDFYPLLIYLIILSIKKTGLTKLHWIFLSISIFVNLWGVIWINKLGFVGF